MENSTPSAVDGVSDLPPAEDKPTNRQSGIRPLRIWPATLIVCLIWGLRIGAGFADEPSFPVIMTQFVAPCGVSILILLWWILFSRALIRERLLGALGMLAIFAVTTALTDKTVTGVGTMIFAIPWGMTAFAVFAGCARNWYPARTALALLAALVGFGYWDLIRIDEIHGDFDMVRSWRWEPTAEDRFLEKLAARSAKSSKPQKVTSESLAVSEWPAFRGAARRGEQPGVELVEDWKTHPPKELWRVPIGPGWSSFSVAGDRLYTQEQRGEFEAVVCYNASDGGQLWVHQDKSRFWETIGGAGPRGTPTIAEDGLYSLGANGLLNRLDPLTGKLVWQSDIRDDANRKPPTWGFSSSPLVTHGLVMIHAGGSKDKGVLAYDKATGDLRWSAAAGDHSYSSPQLSTLDGKQCVVMLTNKGIGFLDPESGNVLGNHDWEFEGYRVVQPLVLDDSRILLGTPMDTGTMCIEAHWDGEQFSIKELWITKDMKPYYNDYVAHNGFLYGFDNGIFACIDLRDGKRQWKRGRYGHGQVLLLPTGNQLLVSSEEGEIVLLRATPERFQEVVRHEVLQGRTWNHPVVVGNRLYVRNGQEAACFELSIK